MKALLLAAFLLTLSAIRGDLEHPKFNRLNVEKFSNLPKPKIFPRAADETDPAYWNQVAQGELAVALATVPNTNVAKNVILFLGDGMGFQNIMAARVYAGQQKGMSGEEYSLSFESFPYVGFSKTYCVDHQVCDSASTGTAYLTGVKTNYGIVGCDAKVLRAKCETMSTNSSVYSFAKWSQDAGKKTGFVTSTRVSHATPASTYAHIAERDWECDAQLPEGYQTTCPSLQDIAVQLIGNEEAQKLHVIMGGGFQVLDGSAVATALDPIDDYVGVRQDGRVLWQEWLDQKMALNSSAAFVRNKTALDALDLLNTEYLMGVFANSHVPYEYLKRENDLDLPTLAEMTEVAITMLSQEPNGYFLLVEGGRIDLAHHASKARIALDETVAFSDAIEKALNMTDEQDTLIIVTGDHSHTMTVSGYPPRGTDITSITGELADDHLPYTTLSYANGPGFKYKVNNQGEVARYNLFFENTTSFDYVQEAMVPKEFESHGGEDVPIYAKGPMAHLFHTTHEQNYIAHVMAYASCVGEYENQCGASLRRHSSVL